MTTVRPDLLRRHPPIGRVTFYKSLEGPEIGDLQVFEEGGRRGFSSVRKELLVTGFRDPEFRTGLVVVTVIDPGTTLTCNDRGGVWMTLSSRP